MTETQDKEKEYTKEINGVNYNGRLRAPTRILVKKRLANQRQTTRTKLKHISILKKRTKRRLWS
jgi:hypothetical protein